MDYISREDAIKALPKHCEYILTANVSYETADIYRIATDHAIDVIKRLPAADVPERNVGKWEKYGEDMQVCSACHKYWIWAGEMYDFKYCPNCGAKMEGIK